MDESRAGRRLARGLWRMVALAVAAVVAMWLADLFVPALRIDGSDTARLLVGGLTGTVAIGTAVVLIIPPAALSSLILVGDAARDTPRPAVSALVGLVLNVLSVALVNPLALKAAVWVLGLFGAPVELSGGWASWLTAALVFWAVWEIAHTLLAPQLGAAERRTWLVGRLSLPAIAGVLGIALAVLPGVHLAAGDRPAVLDVLVLAGVIATMRTALPGRVGALLQVVTDVVAVWVLFRVGEWLARPLSAGGWGDVLVIGLAIALVTLPLRRIAPAAAVSRTAGSVPRRASKS